MSTLSLSWQLDRVAWFKTLPDDLQDLTRNTASEIFADAGEFIAKSGETADYWYGVLHGFVQMYVTGPDGSETTLYCLREGEWGGDGLLLKPERRSYNLVTLTPARVCLIPRATFLRLHAENLAFNHFLLSNMNERVGVFMSMIEAVRLLGPEVRVARGLLILAEGPVRRPGPLRIQQRDLALMCGLSRQRTNIALGVLRFQKLVRVDGSGLWVTDLPALRAYVASQSGSRSSYAVREASHVPQRD